MSWIRKLLGLCEHYFEFKGNQTRIQKGKKYNGLTKKWYPFKESHDRAIYFCSKCGKEILGK